MIEISEKLLSLLPSVRKTNLEAQMVAILGERLGASPEASLEVYYSSDLSKMIEENRYGVQFLDANYLVEELLRMQDAPQSAQPYVRD